MTEIWKDFTFEAAHLLPNLPDGHKCKRLHGHSYRVRVVVSGELDAELGWVMDYAHIADAWQVVYDTLDHRYLNDVLGLENPTTEMVAPWIFRVLDTHLPQDTLVRVEVRETCTAGATYSP
jgi:6-pyruvoyltetrahydropterin/6-carboxytetrahydropterin synthase